MKPLFNGCSCINMWLDLLMCSDNSVVYYLNLNMRSSQLASSDLESRQLPMVSLFRVHISDDIRFRFSNSLLSRA